MSSYQKLKAKYEYCKSQCEIFKNALTIVRKSKPLHFTPHSRTIRYTEQFAIQKNKIIDERIKEELQKWVAFNLDEETIKEYLELKKTLEKEGNNKL